MGRRRPERDLSREIWEKSGGKKSIREISEELGVSQGQLRKWKSEDKWTAKKPRGAPKGNQNAKGHKGPAEKTGLGNRNAETHGAYAKPDDNRLSPEELELASKIHDEILKELVKKYYDLQHRIREIEENEQEKFVTGGIDGSNMVEYWDHKNKWLETLEQRSLKILSRIQKAIDQQQARENLAVHEKLTRESLRLQREKAMGIFEAENDPEEG